MTKALRKLIALATSPHRLAHTQNLVEVRLNKAFAGGHVSAGAATAFDSFRERVEPGDLRVLLQRGGEAEGAVAKARASFDAAAATRADLPFPASFNADTSFALLAYSYARALAPEVAIEMGVGYGVTSALLLAAAARNERGRVISVDLPSLGDAHGSSIGMAIPQALRTRWTLHAGSNRQWLPHILDDVAEVGLFVSDSANVYSVQRFEFDRTWPKLRPGGCMLFNNVGAKFLSFLQAKPAARLACVRQLEKAPHVTAIVTKA
jgi:Methyltransferase domain